MNDVQAILEAFQNIKCSDPNDLSFCLKVQGLVPNSDRYALSLPIQYTISSSSSFNSDLEPPPTTEHRPKQKKNLIPNHRMAYAGGAAGEVKCLAELLEEPQEPFALDVYLSERGYGRRRRSTGGKKAKRKTTARLSKLLRVVCDAAVVIRGWPRDMKPVADGRGECEGAREVAESDRFSSASTAHQPDEPRKGEIKQVDDERNIPWTSSQSNNEQPSIARVTTRETSVKHFDDVSRQPDFQVSPACQDVTDSTCRLVLPKKITEDHSASTFEMMFQCKQERTSFARSIQPLSREISADYLNSKRVLQQRKQLLFDCVKEVIESYRKKDKAGKKNSDMEPDKIGKIICEKIVRWDRTRGNETSIGELLSLEYLETAKEWEDCVHERMQITLKIGDELLEDIINGIVTDLTCH